MKTSHINLAAAAAAIALASTVLSTPASAADKPKDELVRCYGLNSCKGNSQCATSTHDCKGLNDCKGQGVDAKPKSECLAAGGSLTERK
ncbi:MAG: hypothetical protein JO218_09250 [Burkholderiales bacterium]|nr:hypothetical protein [Burkholderiales bacterium]